MLLHFDYNMQNANTMKKKNCTQTSVHPLSGLSSPWGG